MKVYLRVWNPIVRLDELAFSSRVVKVPRNFDHPHLPHFNALSSFLFDQEPPQPLSSWMQMRMNSQGGDHGDDDI